MIKKVCVITGASSAVCSVFAKEMSKNGYSVALIDRNTDIAEQTVGEICSLGGLAKAYSADVLDRMSLEAARKQINSELGKCTVLINGAGGNSIAASTSNEFCETGDERRGDILTFFNLDSDGFDFVLDVNIKGVLIPTQVFSQDMMGEEGCSVVNLSSISADVPATKNPAYSASKAAISNFTKWLAVYFGKTGIRVNAIAPGFLLTPHNKELLVDKNGAPTERARKITHLTPTGRIGTPDDLLGALKLLTDPAAAAFITGTTITVDGGFSAYSGV